MGVVKPRNPVLNPSHNLAGGLVAAWLFTEGSGLPKKVRPLLGTDAIDGAGGTWVSGGLNFPSASGNYFRANLDNTLLPEPITVVVRLTLHSWSADTFFSWGQTVTDSFPYIISSTSRTYIDGNWFITYSDSTFQADVESTYILTMNPDDRIWRVYINGVQLADTHDDGGGTTRSSGEDRLHFGRGFDGDPDATVHAIYVYDRGFSPQEAVAIHADPYQMFREYGRYYPILQVPDGATVNTLTLASSAEDISVLVDQSVTVSTLTTSSSSESSSVIVDQGTSLDTLTLASSTENIILPGDDQSIVVNTITLAGSLPSISVSIHSDINSGRLGKPRNPVLNLSHNLAGGLVAAWLFNEGSGLPKKVRPLLGTDAISGLGGTWVSGGFNFPSASGEYFRVDLDNALLPEPITVVVRLTLHSWSADTFFSWGNSVSDSSPYIIASTNRTYIDGNWFITYDDSTFVVDVESTYILTMNPDDRIWRVYINGIQLSDTHDDGGGTTRSSGETRIHFGRGFDGDPDATVHAIYIYDRGFSPQEAVAIHTNPYGMFSPQVLSPIVSPSLNQAIQTNTLQLTSTIEDITLDYRFDRTGGSQAKPKNPILNPTHPLAKGLVTAWLMVEGSDDRIYDYSGRGRHATKNSTQILWRDEKFGHALEFDGGGVNEHVYLNSYPKPDMPITFVMRVKSDDAAPVGLYDSAPGQTNVLRNYSAGEFAWWANDPDVTFSLVVGEWNDIVVVYYHDGNRQIEVYINGEFYGSETGGTSTSYTFTNFRLGNINSGADGIYDGLIDHFLIYENTKWGEAEARMHHTDAYAMFRERTPIFVPPINILGASLSTLTLVGSAETTTAVGLSTVQVNTLTLTGSAEITTLDTPVSVPVNTITLAGSAESLTVLVSGALLVNTLTGSLSPQSVNVARDELITTNTLTLVGSGQSIAVAVDQVITINSVSLVSSTSTLDVTLPVITTSFNLNVSAQPISVAMAQSVVVNPLTVAASTETISLNLVGVNVNSVALSSSTVSTTVDPGVGAIKTGVTRFSANTSNGTQDITISGFGTPKAVLFIATTDTTDDSIGSTLELIYGGTDGTTQFTYAVNAGGTTRRRGGGTDAVIRIPSTSFGTYQAEADFDQWITDGVRIDWVDAPSAAWTITAIFFGGDSLQAKVGTGTTPSSGGSSNVNVGFTPDAVLGFYFTTTNWTFGDSYVTYGFGVNDDTIINRSLGFTGEYTTWQNRSYISESRFLTVMDTDTDNVDRSAAITDFISTPVYGFEITHYSGQSTSSFQYAYLALRFNGAASVDAGTYSTPTSTGNDTYTGVGFNPQLVLLGLSHLTSVDTVGTGSFGIGVFDEDGNDASNAWMEQDGGTNQGHIVDAIAANIPEEDHTAGHEASYVEMTASGWTLNFAVTLGSSVKWPWFAIESLTATPPKTVTVNTLTLASSTSFDDIPRVYLHPITELGVTGTPISAREGPPIVGVSTLILSSSTENITADNSGTVPVNTLTLAGSAESVAVERNILALAVSLVGSPEIINVGVAESTQTNTLTLVSSAEQISVRRTINFNTLILTSSTESSVIKSNILVDALTLASSAESSSVTLAALLVSVSTISLAGSTPKASVQLAGGANNVPSQYTILGVL